MNDLFFILSDVDDIASFVCDLHTGEIAISWCECNYMKMNNEKCHLLISGNKDEQMWVKKGNKTIWNSNTVNLGMTIYHDLRLEIFVLTE